MQSLVGELNTGISIEPEENVYSSLWKEYERVIIQSIVTSFGLDFIVHDQHGGDVDTIHNVRQVGQDSQMYYKNKQNQATYENREAYDGAAYHSHSTYKNTVREAKKDWENGLWQDDTYVEGNKVAPVHNKTLDRGKQGQLDHVISAHEIHNDAGRILSGLDGKDLANSPDNLKYTNAALNRNMSDMSVEEYIAWAEQNPDKVNYNGKKGEPLPESVKKRLREEHKKAKKSYEAKIAKAYYTSPQFAKDTANAMKKQGIAMGVREALGFVFMEIWYAAKEELQNVSGGLKDMFQAIGNGIKKGWENAKLKYRELLSRLKDGVVAGALSSLTTTICNIFFTTAKNFIKVIRQLYASIVEASKVLFFNPENLTFGERMKKITIILATGASVILGTAVGEMVSKTVIGAMPVVGNIVTTFCSTLVSGLISCSLLLFLDRGPFMNKVVNLFNKQNLADSFKKVAEQFERIVAELANFDIAKFKEETEQFNKLAFKINNARSEEELSNVLLAAHRSLNIQLPWQGDFNDFMSNRSNRLVFR